MNPTQSGLAANAAGLAILLLTGFGIDVSDELRQMLLALFAATGLVINQVLIRWAHRARPPAGELQFRSQSGFARPSFLMVLVMAAVTALAGCAGMTSVQQNSVRAGIQVATLQAIDAGDNPQRRAQRIRDIATAARAVVTGDAAATLSAIEGVIYQHLQIETLSPTDQVIARALIASIVAELQARIGTGVLSADQLVQVVAVLDWVIEATTMLPPTPAQV